MQDRVAEVYLERGVFAEVSLRENKQELGTLSSLVRGLQGMRNSCGEVPQITGALGRCQSASRHADISELTRVVRKFWPSEFKDVI